jgi:uncharacterized protein (TIGR03437 family)
VLNGGALNSPQTPACAPAGTAPLDYTFNVISSSSMAITSVVNAASYSPAAKQIGRDINPVPTGNTAVAPGELISIFGRNLGPAGPLAATGSTAAVVISTAALAAKPNTSALATTLQFSVANPLGTTAVIVDFTNDPKAIAGGEALADIVAYINQQTTGTLGNVASLSNGGSYISLTSPTTGAGTAITVNDNTAAQLLKFTATTGDVTVAGADGEYPTQLDGIQVAFVYAGTTYYAPITMVYNNQINALVPFELSAAPAGNAATVKVLNGAAATSAFGVIIVDEEPGIFTLAGSGTGQGAVVNVDSITGVWTLNSSSAAALGSEIVIYATGLGSLVTPLADTDAATGPDKLSDSVQVMIGGQPAVVTYAGTAAGYIGGIVQINASVPKTVTAGKAVSLYIAGGDANTARQSQGGVTLAVK